MPSWKQIERNRALLSSETGTLFKEHGGRLRIALAYPNSYYVGMSSLALQILYAAFNKPENVVCERTFFDPTDLREGLPLLTLESQTPAGECDVVAVSVSFEMDYFNIAAMLTQMSMPAMASDRDDTYPLLIAGGPAVTMNPEPLAPFFDAMVIGEAEEVLPQLMELLQGEAGSDRRMLLAALDAVPGIYVPSLVDSAVSRRRIRRLWVKQLESLHPVSTVLTPETEFAGMHLVEIARGCGRGCRYCLAGFLYRPPREQPMERILELAAEGLARTDRIGLVSAAVSDHSQIDELAPRLRALGARLSVSSMRTDPISLPLVRALAESGAQTLTIAPEAGTETLRTAIHKTQTEDDLLRAVTLAQQLGFAQLKLYFMIGHPGETDADVDGIVDLAMKARRIFKRNLTINATPFVPKAHTPFQREPMAPAKKLQGIHARLKRSLARHQVMVKSDSPAWAEIQGVLARGDRRLAPVIAELPQPTVVGFYEALSRHGLDPQFYLGARSATERLPWAVVDTGVTDDWLSREAQKRLTGE